MTDMTRHDIAEIVELSEARAYSRIIQSASQELRLRNGFRTAMVGSATAIIAASVKSTVNLNRVIGLGVREQADEGMLDTIDALYREADRSYAIEWSPAAAPDTIPHRLKQRGLRATVSTAMFYRSASAAPAPPVESDLQVRLTGKGHARLVAEICCDSFRMPPAVAELLASTAGQPGWDSWVAFEGEEPVGAALAYIEPPFAWCGWDATRPAHRGKRAQQALIAARLEAAYDAGCDFVTSETAVGTADRPDPSYKNYVRLGFTCGYLRRTYIKRRRESS